MCYQRYLVIVVFLVSITACTIQPPSYAGLELYRQGDSSGAYRELTPLAVKGDPVAQYTVAKISLAGPVNNSISTNQAIEYLTNAAAKGHDGAFGVLLLLSMSQQQRAYFGNMLANETLEKGNGASANLGDSRIYSTSTNSLDHISELVESVAGGPISISTLLATSSQLEELSQWPTKSTEAKPTTIQLLKIDEMRAAASDKYAQLRMANRYTNGYDVQLNLKKAFDLRLKAAKITPSKRNCVYQAPVGTGSGSTYCYDRGNATQGLPQAMLVLCNAFATGDGTKKDITKAVKWCECAAKHPQFRQKALEILDGIIS